MTAFLQTAATVIPVLLVAGLLNSRLLRDNSKTAKSSLFFKILIGVALIATVWSTIALVNVEGKEFSELNPRFAWGVFLLACLGMTCAAAPVLSVALIALDIDPHPDRLKAKRDDLERALRLTETQIAEKTGGEGDERGNGRDH